MLAQIQASSENGWVKAFKHLINYITQAALSFK